jgi:hypothetical protein
MSIFFAMPGILGRLTGLNNRGNQRYGHSLHARAIPTPGEVFLRERSTASRTRNFPAL